MQDRSDSTPQSFAVFAFVVCLCLVLAPTPVESSGFLAPSRVGEPGARAWVLVSQHVDAVVQGPHARVTLEQAFSNPSRHSLSTEYLFPIPDGVALASLSHFDGSQWRKGEILRESAARRHMETVLRRVRNPLLVEHMGRDLYRVPLDPIAPSAVRKMTVKYEQTLSPEGGLTGFRFPLHTALLRNRPVDEVSLRVKIDSPGDLGPIYSPTHDVEVDRPSKREAEVRVTRAIEPGEPEFQVFWTTTASRVGTMLMTYWPKGDARGYFVYVASPADGGEGLSSQPKDILFAVDTSASMAGDKLEQVRVGLRKIIASLGPQDRFNVLAYENEVDTLWDAVAPADAKHRAEALSYVQRLRAAGGASNIGAAMERAVSAPSSPGRVSAVLFLTDGRPTVGEIDPAQILSRVRKRNKSGVRVFVLGVGVDVNSVLLDRLALDNGGIPAYVGPREDVEREVLRLYRTIQHPALTRLTLDLGAMDASDRLPTQLSDLFLGREQIVVGRYARGGRTETVLSGNEGAVRRSYHALLRAGRRGDVSLGDFPARVWALRRIAQRIDQVRLQGREEADIVEEIVGLSTRFGILTEYTSFLAEEGVDHTATLANRKRAGENLRDLRARSTGGSGYAQAVNQGSRRAAPRAPRLPTFYLGTSGDRDVERIEVPGVRRAGERTFFYRGAQGWVDAGVAKPQLVDEEIARWSDRFFELLRTTSRLENARLAQRGTLVLEIDGRVVRIVDRS